MRFDELPCMLPRASAYHMITCFHCNLCPEATLLV